MSLATFKDDILKECDDIAVDAATGLPDGRSVETLKAMRDGLLKGNAEKGDSKNRPVELSRSCSDQFSDRAPLATCSFESRMEQSLFRGRIAVYTYEDAFETDAYMQECLSDWHGEWTAARRDSIEFIRAKHDYVARKLAAAGRRVRTR